MYDGIQTGQVQNVERNVDKGYVKVDGGLQSSQTQVTQNVDSNVGKGLIQIGSVLGGRHSGYGATIQGGNKVINDFFHKTYFNTVVTNFEYYLIQGDIKSSQAQNVESNVGKSYGKLEGVQSGLGVSIQDGQKVKMDFWKDN